MIAVRRGRPMADLSLSGVTLRDRGGIYLVPSLGGTERKFSDLISVANPNWGAHSKALDWSPNGKFLASSEQASIGASTTYRIVSSRYG